jgi:uncharacterized protein (TIGR03067 family)
MRRLALPATLLLAAVTPAALGDERDSDERNLRGLWEIVTWEEEGKQLDKNIGVQYIFIDGDLITIDHSGRRVSVSKTTYRLDVQHTPRRMITTSFGKPHTSIYKLDGDTLVWVYPHSVLGSSRSTPIPTSFTAKVGDKHTLMTLKRVKGKRAD